MAGDPFDMEVTARPESAGAVRRALLRWAGHLPERVRTDLVLVVNELVINAIRHGPDFGRVRISLREHDDELEVGVRDDSLPQVIAPREPDETGGRGLRIVDTLAQAWGVRHNPTQVWCLLRATEPAADVDAGIDAAPGPGPEPGGGADVS